MPSLTSSGGSFLRSRSFVRTDAFSSVQFMIRPTPELTRTRSYCRKSPNSTVTRHCRFSTILCFLLA